jgi:superfamily II DNA helicase RecQ
MDFNKIIDFSCRSKIALCNLLSVSNQKAIFGLREKQIEVLKCIDAERRDMIICLPTGYGKSLIYDILPYFASNTTQPIVIIVCPLISIMNDIVQRHGKLALKYSKETSLAASSSLTFKYLVGSPEDLLDKNICNLMKAWNKRVEWIIVDEAHCVLNWGTDFRPDYDKLSKLRAVFPDAKIIAMTATATNKSRIEIVKHLALQVYVSFLNLPLNDSSLHLLCVY